MTITVWSCELFIVCMEREKERDRQRQRQRDRERQRETERDYFLYSVLIPQ